MEQRPAPMLSAVEIAAFLDVEFPQTQGMFEIEEAALRHARVWMPVDESHLRPGGTISGPTMFWLADCTFYVAVLASIGRQAQAVTTNMNINFMRRPSLNDLVAEARILKLGRRLAVGDVTLFLECDSEPVAHATATYAIPPS